MQMCPYSVPISRGSAIPHDDPSASYQDYCIGSPHFCLFNSEQLPEAYACQRRRNYTFGWDRKPYRKFANHRSSRPRKSPWQVQVASAEDKDERFGIPGQPCSRLFPVVPNGHPDPEIKECYTDGAYAAAVTLHRRNGWVTRRSQRRDYYKHYGSS
jgi:hypothetical protein